MPDDLRKWLELTNAPLVGLDGFFGIRPASGRQYDMETYYDMFPHWKRSGYVPLASDGCGSYFVMPTRREFGDGYPVMFMDHADGLTAPSHIVASSLERFVEFSVRRASGEEGWPFDRQYVVVRDPDILKFEGLPLPWDEH